MSIIKRITVAAFAVVAAVCVMMGGIFCSAADDFGTAEDGIYQSGKSYWIQLSLVTLSTSPRAYICATKL